jgi:hypothetical protein
MKTKFTIWALVALFFGTMGCKKNDDLKPAIGNIPDPSLAAAGNCATPYTVSTIAGSAYISGPTLVDGVGKNARFLYAGGIQLMDDGTIYIADGNESVIRKLSPGGVVSTIKLPAAPGGERMLGSAYVGVAKDGTINVITGSNLNSDFPEAWIFRPGEPAFVYSSYYATYRTLAKDPYEDIFWFTDGFSMEKFRKNNTFGGIGTDRISFDGDSIFPDFGPHSSFSAMCIGYNKVKYLSDGYFLYKYTPDGKSQRIFKELGVEGFTNIRCMVVNKDGRTLYIVDAGYIRRIDQGKVTTIAGPNASHDNRDGIGKQADVHASYLALSKDEGTLYFSDYQANAIRKITLR